MGTLQHMIVGVFSFFAVGELRQCVRHSNTVNRAFMLPSYIFKDDVAGIHRDRYDIVLLGRVTIEKKVGWWILDRA